MYRRAAKFHADGSPVRSKRSELRHARAEYRALPYVPVDGGKTCVACEKKLPLALFSCSKVEGRRYFHSKCIACRSTFNALSPGGRSKRKLIDELRDRPCKDCGGKFTVDVMRFYPVQGPAKFSILAAWTGRSARSIIAEAARCEVVCSNCAIQRRRELRVLARRSMLAELPPHLGASVDLLGRLEELIADSRTQYRQALA